MDKEFKSKYAAKQSNLSDQLQKLKDDDQLKLRKRTPKAHRCAVTDWQGDGIDHINVNSSGATAIGRFLAHESNYKVVNNKLGAFASVRSMWQWLRTRTRDDRLRSRTGGAARALFESLPHRNVQNLRAIILDTDWQKLKQYPEAMKAFSTCTYAIDTYFYAHGSDLPRRPGTFHWLVEGWEELRRAAREEREPDLSQWLDVPGSGIYDFVFNNDGTTPATATAPTFEHKQVRRYDKPSNGQNRNQRKTIASVKDSVIELNNQSETIDASTDRTLEGIVSTVEIVQPVAEEQITEVAEVIVSSDEPVKEVKEPIDIQSEVNRAVEESIQAEVPMTALAAAMQNSIGR